jgi:ribosomal protein L12E/L44/L45/RPP1/RPP2
MSELAATYAALILADEGIEITAEKINALTSAAGIETEPIMATLLAKVCRSPLHRFTSLAGGFVGP